MGQDAPHQVITTVTIVKGKVTMILSTNWIPQTRKAVTCIKMKGKFKNSTFLPKPCFVKVANSSSVVILVITFVLTGAFVASIESYGRLIIRIQARYCFKVYN